MTSKLYALSYAHGTISSILIECPNQSHMDATPLVVANECDDSFDIMFDVVLGFTKANNCNSIDIQPYHVSDILSGAGIEYTYDTLRAINLMQAFNADRARFLSLATKL